jgi:hypothetical protein
MAQCWASRSAWAVCTCSGCGARRQAPSSLHSSRRRQRYVHRSEWLLLSMLAEDARRERAAAVASASTYLVQAAQLTEQQSKADSAESARVNLQVSSTTPWSARFSIGPLMLTAPASTGGPSRVSSGILQSQRRLTEMEAKLKAADGKAAAAGAVSDRHTPWVPSQERDTKDPELAAVLRKVQC